MKPKKILIVGGGTAGWMTAHILAFSLHKHNFEISVIESPDIQPIGVGEGSTPALKIFFDKMGIKESEWMPACNATYKCGITFKDWSTKPGFESYFHPFASQIDIQTLPTFIRNSQARLQGLEVEARPSQFFLSSYLAKNNLAPIAHNEFPAIMPYGYHFDSHLVGQFLIEKAVARGVIHHKGTIEHVALDTDGGIDTLTTKDQQQFKADFYIDCTGFSSLLSQSTLNTPFVSYAAELYNDAAVAMPTEIGDSVPSQTISTALKNGWAWQIPLLNRFGNGYVYSSKYCSADEAEIELRQHLNLLNSSVEARHLKMKVGRVEKSWNKNVLAVGLSQGFIEPLEATALHLIQQTVSLFSHCYIEGNFTNTQETTFNQCINEQFDKTKDYIVAHYKTNSRDDSDYWRDNRENTQHTSVSLHNILECWHNKQDLSAEIKRQKIENFYPVSSWYCLMSGMGMFSDKGPLIKPQNANHYSLAEINKFLSQCSQHFQDHKKVLMG